MLLVDHGTTLSAVATGRTTQGRLVYAMQAGSYIVVYEAATAAEKLHGGDRTVTSSWANQPPRLSTQSSTYICTCRSLADGPYPR